MSKQEKKNKLEEVRDMLLQKYDLKSKLFYDACGPSGVTMNLETLEKLLTVLK